MKKDAAPAARILLVDDNSHGLVARKMILLDHGYGVDTALSGVELIRRIRGTDAPTRIILLSGFIGCLGMTEQSTGADELISKSNKEVPELLRAIRKLSTRPRRRRVSSQGRADGSRSMQAG